MLPYFPQPTLEVGSVTFYSFGFIVYLAIFFGYKMLMSRSQQLRTPLESIILIKGMIYTVMFGFLVSIVFNKLAYDFNSLNAQNWYLPMTWLTGGLSSFGGFLGGIIMIYFYCRYHNVPFIEILDIVFYTVIFAWCIARLGCALAHDHPGVPSNFFLAINYPEGVFGGVPRHNLGLYEMLFNMGLFAIVWQIGKKKQPIGFIAGFIAITYGVGRFLLDFLRAVDLSVSDSRYYYLTPAQWGCLVLILGGLFLLNYARNDYCNKTATASN